MRNCLDKITRSSNRLLALINDILDMSKIESGKIELHLTNLLSNALKFTSAGGHVNLNVKELRHDANEIWMRFWVEDTGRGIAPENLERIFEAFTQENGGISRQYGGTGLGLPITKNFAEMMGGSISISSEVGKGSVFTVDLPL